MAPLQPLSKKPRYLVLAQLAQHDDVLDDLGEEVEDQLFRVCADTKLFCRGVLES